MRRYLVDPINDHRAGVDMAHCYCGVPCLSGTHIYGRNKKMVFQEGPTDRDRSESQTGPTPGLYASHMRRED